ncbi:hypothetical protein MY4038_010320 [Beauveria bassiana]
MKYSMILIAGFASASLAGPIAKAPKQNVPTREEVCEPFKGNEQACTKAIRECLQKEARDPERTLKCVHAAANGGVGQPEQQTQKLGVGKDCALGGNDCADGLVCQISVAALIGETEGTCQPKKEQQDQQQQDQQQEQTQKLGVGKDCALGGNDCADGLKEQQDQQQQDQQQEQTQPVAGQGCQS